MWDGLDLPGAMTYEMRGFGQTPMPPAGTFSHSADLEAAIGDEPVSLVGASYGGLVAWPRPGAPSSSASWCSWTRAAGPSLVGARCRDVDREEQLVDAGRSTGPRPSSLRDFWLADPSPRERVVEMQQRADELQVEASPRERARVSSR